MNPFDRKLYDYELPERLIAQAPVEPRDTARMLVLDRRTGRMEHRTFRDLPEYLDTSDLLVANNSRVIRARLLGQRELEGGKMGGKIEFLLLEEREACVWEGMFRSSARALAGLRFAIPLPKGGFLRGELIRGAHESETGTVVARFDRDPLRDGVGALPLPPYITRAPGEADESSYQTVYARDPGSAAAPTAGFHFTEDLLARVRARGASWDEVTLHVGLGTFRPVKAEDVREHAMHEERYRVPPATADRINGWKRDGKRVVAVGTTAVRTLESAWAKDGVRAGEGRTSLFLHPGSERRFEVVDRLITNFHLPGSTLLMLVCAFAGTEHVLEAYREAVRREYRFFSYGDGMLIL